MTPDDLAPDPSRRASATADALAFYRTPALMTASARHAGAVGSLPLGPAALAGVIQGLLLHEHVGPSYGAPIAQDRRAGSQIRSLDDMLDAIDSAAGEPLSVGRPLEGRLVCVCRHFSVMLAGFLRAQQVPARARCGFATYFEQCRHVDHWVCEYWNAAEARWVMVDAQMDDHQRALFNLDFDPLDVPHDRFLTAGEAWRLFRSGQADASRFGILDMWGAWFIAGNLLRDVAALNNMEMLPWDMWGAMPGVNAVLDEEQLAWFDALAALTLTPDQSFTELRDLYAQDGGLRVPATVFNAIRQTQELVGPA